VPDAVHAVIAKLAPIDRALRQWGMSAVNWVLRDLARHHGSYGVLGGSWPTGSMVLWVAALLGFSLLFYYL
jgi:multicomponent Na+:H+ antiporter subunit D